MRKLISKLRVDRRLYWIWSETLYEVAIVAEQRLALILVKMCLRIFTGEERLDAHRQSSVVVLTDLGLVLLGTEVIFVNCGCDRSTVFLSVVSH